MSDSITKHGVTYVICVVGRAYTGWSAKRSHLVAITQDGDIRIKNPEKLSPGEHGVFRYRKGEDICRYLSLDKLVK